MRMIDRSFFLLSWKVCKAAISAAYISDFKWLRVFTLLNLQTAFAVQLRAFLGLLVK